MTDPDPVPRGAEPRVWPWYAAFAVALVLVTATVAGLLVGTGRPDRPATAMPRMATTVQLADLPLATAELYRYAASHRDHFAELPCFCGCDRMLAHRSLTDCFITPTGAWDAHASGCGICTAEAITARTAFGTGTPVATVRAGLITRYGPPTGTPTPASTWSTA